MGHEPRRTLNDQPQTPDRYGLKRGPARRGDPQPYLLLNQIGLPNTGAKNAPVNKTGYAPNFSPKNLAASSFI
jgi:hypothetical protein